jgi:hypothetical protein
MAAKDEVPDRPSNEIGSQGGQQEVLRRNWLAAAALCTVFAGLALLAAWLTTAPLLRAEAPPGWTLGKVILYDAFFVMVAVIACWGPLAQVFTQVTARGVSQFTLRGRKTVMWDEITEVRTSVNVIVLTSKRAKLRINPFLIGGNTLIQMVLERTRNAAPRAVPR